MAQFVLYTGIVLHFMGQFNSIIYNLRGFHEKALYVEEQRKLEVLRRSRGRGRKKEELTLSAGKGYVPEIQKFCNVSFCYEGSDKPVLQDINLTVRPGENLALVGLNGAGKTMFIKLLCGFYDPTEGEILVDGVDRS